MGKLKQLLAYKNPWLLNWLKNPNNLYALFIGWFIYASASYLFGLTDNHPDIYKLISRLMFWPSILLGGWSFIKQKDGRTQEQKNEETEKQEEIKQKKKPVTDRELLKYFWDTLMGRTPTSKKDATYGVVVQVLAFVFLWYYAFAEVRIFLIESEIFSIGASWTATFLFNFLLSVLAGIIFLYYLAIWRHYRLIKSERPKVEEKNSEQQEQKPKSNHPYLKVLVYLMAFSFLLSMILGYL